MQIFELRGARRSVGAGAAPVAAALALVLLAAGPALGQRGKLRWTDMVYQPGRWQAGQVVPWSTTNPATDTLALVARVDGYSRAPRWRAEVRRLDANGRPGEPVVLVGDRARVVVLTGVSATPLAQHAAAGDAVVQSVIAHFDAQGRPTETGRARLVDRAADRSVARVTVRRPAVSQEFSDDLLAMSRTGRIVSNLGRNASTGVGSNRSQDAVATAGARGVTKVRTPQGEISVNPDMDAVRRMEGRTTDLLTLDRFVREGGLGGGDPVREAQEGATE